MSRYLNENEWEHRTKISAKWFNFRLWLVKKILRSDHILIGWKLPVSRDHPAITLSSGVKTVLADSHISVENKTIEPWVNMT